VIDNYELYPYHSPCQQEFEVRLKILSPTGDTMTPKQLLEHYGGSNLAAAVALGYTEPSIRNWINANKIPYKAQRIIEAVTNGKLVARKEKK
jgi:hypothetical protein